MGLSEEDKIAAIRNKFEGLVEKNKSFFRACTNLIDEVNFQVPYEGGSLSGQLHTLSWSPDQEWKDKMFNRIMSHLKEYGIIKAIHNFWSHPQNKNEKNEDLLALALHHQIFYESIMEKDQIRYACTVSIGIAKKHQKKLSTPHGPATSLNIPHWEEIKGSYKSDLKNIARSAIEILVKYGIREGDANSLTKLFGFEKIQKAADTGTATVLQH